jgi:hypothetical protein
VVLEGEHDVQRRKPDGNRPEGTKDHSVEAVLQGIVYSGNQAQIVQASGRTGFVRRRLAAIACPRASRTEPSLRPRFDPAAFCLNYLR